MKVPSWRVRIIWLACLEIILALTMWSKEKKTTNKEVDAKFSCAVDQYMVTNSGYHLPTYLRCKDGQGDFHLYGLVPDHQTSESRTAAAQEDDQ